MRRLVIILAVLGLFLASLLPATASADEWSWWDCKTALREETLKPFSCFAVLTYDDGSQVEVNFGSPQFTK